MKHNLEKLEQYQREGRGDWWFYPLWKKALYIVMFPFIMGWIVLCWLIMKLGHMIFVFGDFLSGWKWNEGNWMEDV